MKLETFFQKFDRFAASRATAANLLYALVAELTNQ